MKEDTVFFLEQRTSPLPTVSPADLGPTATRESLAGLWYWWDSAVRVWLLQLILNIFFTFFHPQLPYQHKSCSNNGWFVQFSSTFWSGLRSSGQRHWRRQWQTHQQMSTAVNRHKDCHCSSPNPAAFTYCPAYPPEVVDPLCWKQKFETKGTGNGNLLPFSCNWVLCGKCTPPSLSENQQECNSQRCCSRGDLHCQVDLWCFWADRLPWAREEVGLQRKEERRLNLHQNVWLPAEGRGEAVGEGGKSKSRWENCMTK